MVGQTGVETCRDLLDSLVLDSLARRAVGEHVPKDDLRLVYDAWCTDQGVEALKAGPLTSQLKELTGGRVRPTKCRNGEAQYHAYKNLVLTPEALKTYHPCHAMKA